MTQEELAELVSADGEYLRQSDISRLERGDVTLPRWPRLKRIADALALTPGELLARSGWKGAELYLDVTAEGSPPATSKVTDTAAQAARLSLPDLNELRARRRNLQTARQGLSVQADRLVRNQRALGHTTGGVVLCLQKYGPSSATAQLAGVPGERQYAVDTSNDDSNAGESVPA